MLVVLPFELLKRRQVDPVELDARLDGQLRKDFDPGSRESDGSALTSEIVAPEEGEVPRIRALKAEAVADLDVLE